MDFVSETSPGCFVVLKLDFVMMESMTRLPSFNISKQKRPEIATELIISIEAVLSNHLADNFLQITDLTCRFAFCHASG
jgi:hypothetical protein